MPWSRRTITATTTARGYGNTHTKARKAAAARHKPTDTCTRCHHTLGPIGSHLHYDHEDDRNGYRGFSHGSTPCPTCGQRCNLTAGARKGARISNTRRKWARPVSQQSAPRRSERW